LSRAPIFLGILAKIYARRGRLDDCAHLEAELEERRVRGEYIPRACDAMIAIGRNDADGVRKALEACLDEQANWFTVRMGAGPQLEAFRSDPAIEPLIDRLYDAD
jgi:hypothetical protein